MAEEALDLLKKLLVNGKVMWRLGEDGQASATLANTPENRVYHYEPELDALRAEPALSGKVAFKDDMAGIAAVTHITVSHALLEELNITPCTGRDELQELRSRAREYMQGTQSWRQNGSFLNTTFTPPSDVTGVISVFGQLASVYGPEVITVDSFPFGTHKGAKITVASSFASANMGEEPQQPLKQGEEWWEGGRFVVSETTGVGKLKPHYEMPNKAAKKA